jgi:hypothetical protein
MSATRRILAKPLLAIQSAMLRRSLSTGDEAHSGHGQAPRADLSGASEHIGMERPAHKDDTRGNAGRRCESR